MMKIFLLPVVLVNFALCFNLESEMIENVLLKSCVSRVTETIFGKETILHYISSTGFENLALTSDNPKVIFNFAETLPTVKFPTPHNFIIDWDGKDYDFFYTVCNMSITNGKFLFIVPSDIPLEDLFYFLWNRNIIYAAVLTYSEDNVVYPTLYTSNPQEIGNSCGRKAEVMVVQSCKNENLKNTLPKAIRNFNKCKVVQGYAMDNLETARFRSSLAANIWVTMEALNDSLNATAIAINGSRRSTFAVSTSGIVYEGTLQSKVFMRDDWIWIAPQPEVIIGPIIFLRIFRLKVWLALVGVFVAVILVWWLVLRYKFKKTDSMKILLNAFYLLLFGNVHRMPKLFALRFVILTYIICAIHLQTAYVSKLIPFLTIPRYEQGVNTLQRLIESPYPIHVFDAITEVHFEGIMANDTRHPIIKSKIKVRSSIEDILEELRAFNNLTTVLHVFQLRDWESELNYTFPQVFIDNSILNRFYAVFDVYKNLHFVDTLNKIIDGLTEGGIYQKWENDVSEYHDKMRQLRQETHHPVVLNLHHLYGIFIIYGCGIAVAFVVFLFELRIDRHN